MNFDEFNRVFCKGMFKEALMDVNQNFSSLNAKASATEDVQLFVKIGEYQRQQMFTGLDPKGDQYVQGRQILKSLNDITQKQGEQRNYRKFVDEMMEKKANPQSFSTSTYQQELMKEKVHPVDPFVAGIKFIEGAVQAKPKNQKIPEIPVKKSLTKPGQPQVQPPKSSVRNKPLTLLEMQKRLNSMSLEDDGSDSDSSQDNTEAFTVAKRAREKVDIPKVYFEKNYEERLKDKNDLLTRFQKLLSQAPKSQN